MIYIAKVFALLLGLMVITKTYLDYKKKQENFVMFLFWAITWIAIIYIALYPITIDRIINLLGGQKTGLGTVFGMGLIFVFFVLYRVYHKANRLEVKLREMVTKLGLSNIEENHEK